MLQRFKCITVFIFLIIDCFVLSLSTRLNIERGDRDVFDNPKCDSSTGDGCRNCGDLKATCVNSTCKRCICAETYGTFLPSNDTNDGQCVKNRHLLFIPAFGCYEFVDPSSAILVTDMRKCSQKQCVEERQISVRYNFEETLCFVMWDKLQYLYNDEWKQLPFRDRIFTIDKRNTMTFLKLNFTKATNDWTGYIVKLNFYCARNNLAQVNTADINCIVIKFKGAAIYPSTIPATVSTGKLSNSTAVAEKSKSDLSNVTGTVIGVVIPILILCAILGFIFFKRRRRLVTAVENKQDTLPATQQSGDTINIIYSPGESNLTFFSDGEETFNDPQTGGSRECELYEPSEPKTEASMNSIYSVVDDDPTLFFSDDEETFKQPQTGASGECELYESGEPKTEASMNSIYSAVNENPTPSFSGDEETFKEPQTSVSTECELYEAAGPQTDASINSISSGINSGVNEDPTPFFSGDEETFKEPQTSVSTECELYEAGGPQTDASINSISSGINSGVNEDYTPFSSGDEATYQEPQTGDSRECELYEPGESNVYECTDVEQNGKRPPPPQEHAYDYVKRDDVRSVAQRLLVEKQLHDDLRDADSRGVSKCPIVYSKEMALNDNDEQYSGQNPLYQSGGSDK